MSMSMVWKSFEYTLGESGSSLNEGLEILLNCVKLRRIGLVDMLLMAWRKDGSCVDLLLEVVGVRLGCATERWVS